MTDVLFQNITIHDSNSGIAIQQRGPGNIDRITFRDIKVESRYENPRWWGNGEWLAMTSEPRSETNVVGSISNLVFENIQAVSENGGLLSGRGHAIENVTMKNVHVIIKAISNYSDGTGPQCSFLVGNDTIVPIPCMGTLDYRPSLIQGDDPNCISWGACRTKGRAHGIYLENVRNASLQDWVVEYSGEWQPWYGECVVGSLSVSMDMHNVSCVQ